VQRSHLQWKIALAKLYMTIDGPKVRALDNCSIRFIDACWVTKELGEMEKHLYSTRFFHTEATGRL